MQGEINLIRERILLPLERRRKILPFLTLVALIFSLTLLTLLFIYIGNVYIIKIYERRLKEERGLLRSLLTAQPTYREEEKKLILELKKIRKFLDKRVEISPKLSAISNLTPGEIWIKRISMKGERFIIEGASLNYRNRGLEIITRFMERLGNNSLFKEKLGKMELEEVKGGEIEELKVLFFRLVWEKKSE